MAIVWAVLCAVCVNDGSYGWAIFWGALFLLEIKS